MSERTLVVNANLLTMADAPLEPGSQQVLIERGRVAAIGQDLRLSDVPTIDARGGTVMPGMIDAHRHVWQSRPVAG